MKKLTTVFLSLTLLVFIGCSNDDSPEPDYLTPLVGIWETSSVSSSGCTNPDDNGVLTCTGAPCFVVNINSNGTYTLVNNVDQQSEAGTVTVTETQITFCETGATDCSPNNYTIDAGSLTVTFTEEDSPGCIFLTSFTKQ